MICYIFAKIYIIIICVPTGFIFYIFINIIPGSYIVFGKSYMFLWYRKNTTGMIEKHFPDFYDQFYGLKHAHFGQIGGWSVTCVPTGLIFWWKIWKFREISESEKNEAKSVQTARRTIPLKLRLEKIIFVSYDFLWFSVWK